MSYQTRAEYIADYITEKKLEPEERAELIALLLEREVNSGHAEEVSAEIITHIRGWHRTLQQVFGNQIILGFIHNVAKDGPDKFDGRNIALKQMCDTIATETPYRLPLI